MTPKIRSSRELSVAFCALALFLQGGTLSPIMAQTSSKRSVHRAATTDKTKSAPSKESLDRANRFDRLSKEGRPIGPSRPLGGLRPAPQPEGKASFLPHPASVVPTNGTDIPLGVVGQFNFDEPLVTINPTNPLNVVVTSHRGMRPSVDGGATYLSTILYPTTLGDSDGDTAVAFDSQGRMFWGNLVFANDGDIEVMQTNPLNGATVAGPVNVQTASGDSVAGFDDKEFMAADRYPASSYTDNLYTIWTKFGSSTDVYFSRSTNQGVAWSTPLKLSASAEGFPWPTSVAVAPNGDVYAAYHAGGDSGTNGDTWVLRSTDGGATFPQKNEAFTAGQSDVTFNVQGYPGTIPKTQFWMQGSVQPWLLADPVRPGHVYVVSNDDPDDTHGSGDDADVVISRSTDNGATWSVSKIPDGSSGADQVFPFAAIDEKGDIAVAWYDTRRGLTNGFGRLLLDVYATFSLDGGATWAPAFMVNDPNNPFDPDFPDNQRRFPTPQITPCAKTAATANETCRIGEYFGIDIHNGTAYVTWEGNARDSSGTVTGDQEWVDSFTIADVQITKTESVDPVTAGSGTGNLVYTVTAKNLGPATATGVAVDESLTLPSGVSVDSIVPSSGTTYSDPTWTIGSLDAGNSATLTVTLTVGPSTVAGTDVISDTATLSAAATQNDPANDTATESTSVATAADLSITKTDSSDPIGPGDPLVYTVTVQNNGPSDAAGVKVTDTLPSGLSVVSTTGCAEDPNGAPTCTLGSISALGSAQYKISTTADTALPGVMTNSASVAATTTDPNSSNNSTTEETTLVSPADVTATKEIPAGAHIVGDTITYTVTLHNAGPSIQFDNPGDEFSDTLPSELTLVDAQASTGSIATSGNQVTWNGSIPASGDVTITIEARIALSAAGVPVSNQGTVYYDADGNGTNESSRLTDDPTVGGSADATVFVPGTSIPAATPIGLLLLGVLLGGVSLLLIARRGSA